MVGELSKYQRVTVTPTKTEELVVSHNLGVVPKIVLITSNEEYVSTTFLKDGILNQNCGCMRNVSSSGYTINAYTVSVNETGVSNSFAYLSDTEIKIRRATSARYFDTNTQYTVDIYA